MTLLPALDIVIRFEEVLRLVDVTEVDTLESTESEIHDLRKHREENDDDRYSHLVLDLPFVEGVLKCFASVLLVVHDHPEEG